MVASTPAGEVTDDAIRAALVRADRRDRPGAQRGQRHQDRRASGRTSGSATGESVELPARRVTISRLDVLAIRRDTAGRGRRRTSTSTCSSGTYIRAHRPRRRPGARRRRAPDRAAAHRGGRFHPRRGGHPRRRWNSVRPRWSTCRWTRPPTGSSPAARPPPTRRRCSSHGGPLDPVGHRRAVRRLRAGRWAARYRQRAGRPGPRGDRARPGLTGPPAGTTGGRQTQTDGTAGRARTTAGTPAAVGTGGSRSAVEQERSGMQRWRGYEAAPGGWGRSVVTIGVFDGVHRGHQAIIGHAVARAQELGVRSVVVTFDPHPAEVVRPGSHPAVLTEPARKAELIEALGVDVLCVVPFTAEFSRLPAEAFVHDVLVEHLHAAAGRGGRELPLRAQGRRRRGAAGTARPDVRLRRRGRARWSSADGTVFSSTYIRVCVDAGDVRGGGRGARPAAPARRASWCAATSAAASWASRPPTCCVHRYAAVPADGVYAGWLVRGGEPQRLPAAISIGTNPTFSGRERAGRGVRAGLRRRPVRRAGRPRLRRAPAGDSAVTTRSSRWSRRSAEDVARDPRRSLGRVTSCGGRSTARAGNLTVTSDDRRAASRACTTPRVRVVRSVEPTRHRNPEQGEHGARPGQPRPRSARSTRPPRATPVRPRSRSRCSPSGSPSSPSTSRCTSTTTTAVVACCCWSAAASPAQLPAEDRHQPLPVAHRAARPAAMT